MPETLLRAISSFPVFSSTPTVLDEHSLAMSLGFRPNQELGTASCPLSGGCPLEAPVGPRCAARSQSGVQRMAVAAVGPRSQVPSLDKAPLPILVAIQGTNKSAKARAAAGHNLPF